jgi:UDP-2-acetamido-2-deoxy-ribo-hexuluronate aminotransferase
MVSLSIQMVDLKSQYIKIKAEIDAAMAACIDSTAFINGPQVNEFTKNLAAYLGVKHVIPCANGTDALQIALMALKLSPGDEVITPAFSYVAPAEVSALLGLKPVLVDVHADTFDLKAECVEKALTPRTKAIVPVHLFGQCADMEAITVLARKHNLYIVEDAAQALGAEYTFSDGKVKRAGTIGDIGCTSFFPTKNLGCFGDGGALFTDNDLLAEKIRKIANHGQAKKFHHEIVGINSRLDTLQAAVLKVKLKYLNQYAANRNAVAAYYDQELGNIAGLQIPQRHVPSTHVFNQYTVVIKNGGREQLKAFLQARGIPSKIYYPLPLHAQPAFRQYQYGPENLPVTEQLCTAVLSLPIHTEMNEAQLQFITASIIAFFATTNHA